MWREIKITKSSAARTIQNEVRNTLQPIQIKVEHLQKHTVLLFEKINPTVPSFYAKLG